MMFEWAAGKTTEITSTAFDLEFLSTDTNEDRGVQNLEFVLQQMHTALMALTSYEANDIAANSPTTGGRKRNLLRMITSPRLCSLLELQAGVECWESCVSRYEKKLKNDMVDEIKLADLEALVPEELEKHLILNSNRLRTCDDARLKVVTYVEAKFGLRIRDSKPSDTGAPGSSGKEKGTSSPRDRCFKSGGAHFQRDCNARNSTGKQSSGKGKQSKSWSKSEGKVKKENKGKSNGKSRRNQKCEPRCQRCTQRQNIESGTRKRMQARTFRNLHRHTPRTFPGTMVGTVTNGSMAGVLMNGMMTGVLLDGTKAGNKRMTLPRAHFHLEVWMSVPPVVRSGLNCWGWGHIPIELWPRRSGRFSRTASGEWIPNGGAWHFQGYDENGLLRSLNGRLTVVHKVLCSAAEIACKRRQDFYLGHDVGYMIPIHSKVGQGMRTHFENFVNWYGKNELISVYLDNNISNFYVNREVKSTETNDTNNAQQWCARKSNENSETRCSIQLVKTSNHLVNLVQMSKWETKKMRNPGKQKFQEPE